MAESPNDRSEEIEALQEEIADLRDELDQARVQLAGCLTAAEGHTSNPAKQGDYGWSLAYQKTLELRVRYEALRFAAQELLNELPVPLPDATASTALELKLVLDETHQREGPE